MHQASERFWRCFDNLPENIQQLAKRNFELLKNDNRHPSLHFKKGGKFRSVRIGLYHRALAVEDEDGFIWVWIGSHKEYDKIIEKSS